MIYDRMLDEQGQLYYPVSDNPKSPWVSELFGDATLVNGKLFPYLEVEPRKYRFRLLNVANSRFFHLSFSNGQVFHQVGADQGLLPAPVPLKDLQLAPGERADLIVDFAGQGGAQIVLSNLAFNILQFRVAKSGPADTSSLPASLRPMARIAESSAVRTRRLSLVGWKDTVRADVGMVTRIITRFEGFTGRYVWHCHVLEHEDNEMMRPFEVMAAP